MKSTSKNKSDLKPKSVKTAEKVQKPTDWAELRKKAAWTGGELPEDEIRRLRRRGL